jgi:lipopolysaccharide transport system ATP-binding protein
VLKRGEEYTYSYIVNFSKTALSVRFGMLIKTITGFELGGSSSSSVKDPIKLINAGTRVVVRFQFKCLLLPGVYFLNAGSTGYVDGRPCFLHRIVDAAMFRVQQEGSIAQAGIVDFCIEPSITIEKKNKTRETA